VEDSVTRSRFVVLRHDVGSKLTRTDQSHFDWMFEVGSVLRTWATQPIEEFERWVQSESVEVGCDLLSDHRLAYLDYEGEIEGDRGSVVRLLRGSYRLIENDPDRFVAALSWDEGDSTGEAIVTCYRSLPDDGLRRDESRDCWRLRFSPGRNDTNR